MEIDISHSDISCFNCFHNKRTFVLWFLAIYFVFELKVGDTLSLKYYVCLFQSPLSAVVEYFDRNLGYIPSVQIYCHKANLPTLYQTISKPLCATAIKLYIYKQVTVPKGAIVAHTGLRSDIHLRERPRSNIRPCHCVGIQIAQPLCGCIKVYQSIKPSHCAGVSKYIKVLNLAIVRVYQSISKY